jgi:hypothetical protein
VTFNVRWGPPLYPRRQTVSEPNSELTLDVISTKIDREVFDWLYRTAETAESQEQVAALYAGAVAGITRFMWTLREPHMTPEGLADHVRRDVLNFAEQARDSEAGGRA